MVAAVATLGWLTTTRARGRVDGRWVDLGRTITRVPQLAGRGEVLLNGHTLRVARGRSPHDLERVMAHFRARCVRGEDPTVILNRLRSDDPLPDAPPSSPLDIVDARMGSRSGHLACAPTPRGLADALFGWNREGPPMRLLFAEREGTATSFAAVWSEGPLEPAVLDGREGTDLPGVPVPAGARRVLSLEVPDSGDRLAVYALERIDTRYREQLERAGWRVSREHSTSRGPTVSLARRAGRAVFLTWASGAEGGASLVLMETSDPNRATSGGGPIEAGVDRHPAPEGRSAQSPIRPQSPSM